MKRDFRSGTQVIDPVYDPMFKNQMKEILNVQLNDNVRAVVLGQNNDNISIVRDEWESEVRAQMHTYELVKKWEVIF